MCWRLLAFLGSDGSGKITEISLLLVGGIPFTLFGFIIDGWLIPVQSNWGE